MTTPAAPLVLHRPARRPRSAVVLLTLSVLLALWLGLTAPSASPVTPVSLVPAPAQADAAADDDLEVDLRERDRRRDR